MHRPWPRMAGGFGACVMLMLVAAACQPVPMWTDKDTEPVRQAKRTCAERAQSIVPQPSCNFYGGYQWTSGEPIIFFGPDVEGVRDCSNVEKSRYTDAWRKSYDQCLRAAGVAP